MSHLLFNEQQSTNQSADGGAMQRSSQLSFGYERISGSSAVNHPLYYKCNVSFEHGYPLID